MVVYKKISGNIKKEIIPIFDLVEPRRTKNGANFSNDRPVRNELRKNNYISRIKNVSICNTHATNDAYVDIYYSEYEFILADPNNYTDEYGEDSVVYRHIHPTNKYSVTTTEYYLAKELKIAHGDTFILEEEDFVSFDSNMYSLCVKLKASDASADVIINKINNNLNNTSNASSNGDNSKY